MSRVLWDRFRAHYVVDKVTGLSVDVSRMGFGDEKAESATATRGAARGAAVNCTAGVARRSHCRKKQ